MFRNICDVPLRKKEFYSDKGKFLHGTLPQSEIGNSLRQVTKLFVEIELLKALTLCCAYTKFCTAVAFSAETLNQSALSLSLHVTTGEKPVRVFDISQPWRCFFSYV